VIENGEYLKDLSYLNRDLKKVIVIEKDQNVIKKHPNNAIFLSEFKGD
jgi:import inner membrane translocase subunit TIM50